MMKRCPDSDKKVHKPTLLGLPEELKTDLCMYLAAHDVASLPKTCKALAGTYQFALLPPHIETMNHFWFKQTGDTESDDRPRKCEELPLLLQRHIHSVRFEFTLRTRLMGPGAEQGRIWIVEEKAVGHGAGTTFMSDSAMLFAGGRVMYESPLATDTDVKLTAWFRPMAGMKYHLWSSLGNAGMGMLSLKNGKLQLFVRDDGDWNYCANFHALVKAELIPMNLERTSFYRRFLMTFLEGAIHDRATNGDQGTHGASIESHLITLLRQYDMTTSLSGLKVALAILKDAQDMAEAQQRIVMETFTQARQARRRRQLVIQEGAAEPQEQFHPLPPQQPEEAQQAPDIDVIMDNPGHHLIAVFIAMQGLE